MSFDELRLASPRVRATRKPYRFGHAAVLSVARAKGPPALPGNRVSDFSGWVHTLYLPTSSTGSLASGRLGEMKLRSHVPAPSSPLWELVHDGMLGANPAKENRAYQINRLTVAGAPLFGRPDWVFRHRQTKGIVIIEIKTPMFPVLPAGAWPDARAQLWAYGQIDEWADAPDVILRLEAWSTVKDVFEMVGSETWDQRDPDFDRQGLELFEAYGGRRRS